MPNAKRALHAHTDDYPLGGSFARLLDWHLVHWNTTPGCSLTQRNPQTRTLKDFAFAIHLRAPPAQTDDNPERKLRYWRKGPTLPDLPQIVEDICFQLFGEDEKLSKWKTELVLAYERERQANPVAESTVASTLPADPPVDLHADTKPTSSDAEQSHDRSSSIRKQVDRVIAVVLGSAAYDGLKRFITGSTQQATPSSDEAEPSANPSGDRAETLILIREGTHLRPIDRQMRDSASFQQFVEWIEPEVSRVAPDRGEPVLVQTTLNLRMQHAAAESILPILPKGAEGALTTIDCSGAVRAMQVGIGNSLEQGRSIDSLREAGAAWRVFAYADAFMRGVSGRSRCLDQPMRVNGWDVPQSQFAGMIDLRTAFAYSSNSVLMQLALQSGFEPEKGFPGIENVARRFGISTPISRDIKMPLGSSMVNMIEMARAFAILAARGNWIEPFGVTTISTMDGQIVFQREEPPVRQAIDARVARSVTDLLQSAAASGAAKPSQFNRPVAGLAGTSLPSTDGWFIGFSSGLTTSVWMGSPEGRRVDFAEGRIAARAFANYMSIATIGRPREEFETPLTLPDWELESDYPHQMTKFGDLVSRPKF